MTPLSLGRGFSRSPGYPTQPQRGIFKALACRSGGQLFWQIQASGEQDNWVHAWLLGLPCFDS